jgi:hypothetical protein
MASQSRYENSRSRTSATSTGAEHSSSSFNIRRSVWRSHLKYETKTHQDEEDPGVVPIIEPLRVVLDVIKPECASGWMFPNTIGGELDLDNLADRIQADFQCKRVEVERLHAYRRGLATNLHELCACHVSARHPPQKRRQGSSLLQRRRKPSPGFQQDGTANRENKARTEVAEECCGNGGLGAFDNDRRGTLMTRSAVLVRFQY